MRTILDGQLWLSYSQAYVTSGGDEHPQLATCFAGQRNGLLGAALQGCLYLVTGLHTGSVPITVEVHAAEPVLRGAWEEVVEATFVPDGEAVHLAGCLANEGHAFTLDPVPHRVRYCASGMDAARSADTRSDGEPEIDRYLLQFWPAPPEADRIVRQTSEIAAYWHGVARSQPSPDELAARRRAEAEQEARRRAAEEEAALAARQTFHDRMLWGGPRPADPLGSVPDAASVARVDRQLAEELVRLPPARRRETARWVARAALVEAGLDGIDWIVSALAALEAGTELPEPFDDPGAPVNRLLTDPRVEHRSVTTPDGRTENVSQQAMGLYSLITAADPDPVRALFTAVQHAQLTFGRDRLDVLHAELRGHLGGG